MRITNLMSEALVLPEIKAVTRDEALRELVEHLFANADFPLDRPMMLERLIERERLASTAVGRGIAIPHAKLPQLEEAIACLGRSRVGVDFGSRDGAPTFIFLTILAPEGNAGLHLKALARASVLLMDNGFREQLTQLESARDIWQVLSEFDERLES